MRAKNGSRFEIGRTMEFEILVAIVGILAALAIPNLLTALQRSKQKRALSDLTAVATALRNFAGDHNGQYPDPRSFQQALIPAYIRFLPTRDPWGNPFRYECWSDQGGTGCDAFAIGSAGKDGVFDRDSLRGYDPASAPAVKRLFDADLVVTNRTPARIPQGPSAFTTPAGRVIFGTVAVAIVGLTAWFIAFNWLIRLRPGDRVRVVYGEFEGSSGVVHAANNAGAHRVKVVLKRGGDELQKDLSPYDVTKTTLFQWRGIGLRGRVFDSGTATEAERPTVSRPFSEWEALEAHSRGPLVAIRFAGRYPPGPAGDDFARAMADSLRSLLRASGAAGVVIDLTALEYEQRDGGLAAALREGSRGFAAVAVAARGWTACMLEPQLEPAFGREGVKLAGTVPPALAHLRRVLDAGSPEEAVAHSRRALEAGIETDAEWHGCFGWRRQIYEVASHGWILELKFLGREGDERPFPGVRIVAEQIARYRPDHLVIDLRAFSRPFGNALIGALVGGYQAMSTIGGSTRILATGQTAATLDNFLAVGQLDSLFGGRTYPDLQSALGAQR